MVCTFPSYVTGIAVAVAVLAALTGAYLLAVLKRRVHGVIAFVVAAVSGGIIAPMVAMDRVVLDDEKLEQTTGFWFAPTVKGFQLADVSSVTIGTAREPRGPAYEVWIVQMKNGQTREIDPGDLWEINGPDIIRRLREKGIEVR